MDIIESENEQKEIIESKDLLKLNIKYQDEKYLLKIFPSKDNLSIIFKLEKENIETYYYYAKLDFNNFKQINKKFISDKNIFNVYIRLKEIIKNYSCSLDKNRLKILISFKKQNSEFSPTFILRKKIVKQHRINYQLVQQIQENKSKIKLLKKQITKLNKIIENKNDLINNINNNLDRITNAVNNINKNVNSFENNEQENNKENKKNDENNNKKSTSVKEEENEDIFSYKSNEQENILLKKNLTLTKEEYKQNGQKQESKRYKDNSQKKDSKNTINHFKLLFKAEENKPEIAPDSQEDTLFCFENVEVFKNKKIYETLILFNIITVLIIIYLLCSIFSLKSNLTLEKIKDQELMKKFAFLSFLEDNEEDDIEGMRENIVDFQLKNNFDDNTNNTNKKTKFNFPKKKKDDNSKELSLLNDDREKRYFKKHIRKRIGRKIKEINFVLIYNSKEKYKYRNFYNNFKDLNEILVLIRIKNGKKVGFFSNNIFSREQNSENDNNDYIGFVFKNEQITEIDLQFFFNDYGKYIQNIYDFLNNENIRIQSRINGLSNQLLEDLELFEVYQIKY